MSNILKIDNIHPESDLIARAAKILRNGGVIGYPTETVYGVGCSTYIDHAVNRVYDLKHRDKSKAMILIAADILQVSDIVDEIPDAAEKLMENFWPGPLTIVFNTSSALKDFEFGRSKTIAIRIPDNPICLSLLKFTGFPLVSTSANISGQPAATTAQEVVNYFGDQLDLVIDGGITPSTDPSTVIDVTRNPARIIREGAITPLEIGTVIDLGF